MSRVSVLDLTSGGGMCGRWNDDWARTGELVASKRFRMAAPSKGAPMKSSDGFELRGCWAPAEAAAAAALETGLSEKRLGRAAAKADEVEKSPWGRRGEGFVRRAVGG